MTTTTGQPDDSVQRLLPWLVAVAFFMQSHDTTSLNTAGPAIAQAMHVTPLDRKSVLASYTLSLAVFIPISGWMADRFGTRKVFGGSIAVFSLGSLLCGISTNITMLVACRVLQGVGGAMMVPVGRMIMVRTFPKSELIRAMSFVSIPSLIGPMLGPVVGGLIVHYLHWSVVFFVNLPVGLLGLYLVRRYLPDYREADTHPLDVVGLILFGVGGVVAAGGETARKVTLTLKGGEKVEGTVADEDNDWTPGQNGTDEVSVHKADGTPTDGHKK